MAKNTINLQKDLPQLARVPFGVIQGNYWPWQMK